MRHFFRAGAAALTLLAALNFGTAGTAQARSHFSLSIGIPLGYYGGGYYGGPFGRGHFGRGWFGAGLYGAPALYRPYYEPFYGPRYSAPITYSRPAYRRPAYGPIFSLGLFPAYVGDAMSVQDRDLYLSAYRRALAAPVGEGMAWNSANASGSVTTTRDGWAGERYCREFRQDITIGGNAQEAYGTVCQTASGDWQLVQDQ